MRTLVRLTVVAATIFAMSSSAEAVERFRFQTSVKGASAFSTNCPDVETPRNVTCSFTSLFANRFKGKDNGRYFEGSEVFVGRLTVRFDGEGLGTVIAGKSGFDEAEVSVRGRLAKASVDTVLPLCDDVSGRCVDTRLRAEWVATSGRQTFKARIVDTFDGTRIEFTSRDTFRAASVRASLGSADFGPLEDASIFYSRFTELLECEITCEDFGELTGVGDTTTASPREILRSHSR